MDHSDYFAAIADFQANRSQSFSDATSVLSNLSGSGSDSTYCGSSEWVDLNGTRHMSIRIQDEVVEDVVCEDEVQSFDLLDFAVEKYLVDDKEVNFVVGLDLYHTDLLDEPINPRQSWYENGVEAGQNLRLVVSYQTAELHFKVEFADTRRTVVIDAVITDSLFHVIFVLLKYHIDLDGLTIDDVKIYHKDALIDNLCGHSPLYNVIDYEGDTRQFYSFTVQIRARGGVIKKHLKKEQQVKDLIGKSSSFMSRQHGDDSPSGEIPATLRPALQPVLDIIENIKAKVRNNEDVISEGLNMMSDEQLETIKTIFEQGNKVRTETKLFQASHIMIKDLENLENCIEHIKKTKHDAVLQFMEAFASKFSQASSSGSLEYSVDKFKPMIEQVISYRRGIRQGVSNGDANENASEDASNRCIVM